MWQWEAVIGVPASQKTPKILGKTEAGKGKQRPSSIGFRGKQGPANTLISEF